MTDPNGRAKRAVDLLVGALAMVMSAPLLGALAIAIKWSSPGPVLFRQERVGRGRRPFMMLKLRTMVDGADRMVAELLARGGTDERFYKFEDDPRVTRVGAFLRRWSLDELPQLWNVLRGEMSLVGPRPALASEVRAYAPWHLRRLEVRPGMTGAWQVSGRSELGFDDCVRLDLAYIDGWRLTRDVGILIRTAPAVLRRRGAL
ncbi:sugar transferase [Actinoallomurus spadix]|uniref:Bacterial sugar transferase domain-containing protein n=1 Tax=Actinoallomurus spadix TaxID=79912 RepID=A0ABN0VQR0_9ACTN|nr:sugar transferase [Actinoallomurus spadix]MCO5990736.1 sugar transferase [Actinoallomurus spadix]